VQAFWLSAGDGVPGRAGDKTQLVALALSTRYNARTVLAGVFVATLAVHLLSTAIGGLAGELLPTAWIRLAAGLAFIAFAAWTLRGDELDDERGPRQCVSPFWCVFVTFFLAELGDKTMLSTITLAAGNPFVPIWLGSTIGMVLSDALAIGVGQLLGAKLPERAVKTGAAIIFLLFGLYSLYSAGPALGLVAWSSGTALSLAAAIWLLRGRPRRPLAEERA